MKGNAMVSRMLFSCLLLQASLAWSLDLDATLDWRKKVELGLLGSGIIKRLPIQAGQRVERDQLLLELDQAELEAFIVWGNSNLTLARLEQEEAQRELDRTMDLYERTLLSDHEKQQAMIDAASAKARLHQAEAYLAQLRQRLGHNRITAPFGGRIIQLNAYTGQALVNRLQTQSLMVLVDDATLLARAKAPVDLAAKLSNGSKVGVVVRGEWLPGQVDWIGWESLDMEGSYYDLVVAFKPMSEMNLRAGERVVVRIDE
jgi:multidrug efflux system membrane fusion protein